MVVRKSVYTEWSLLELQGLSRETLIERSSALKFMLLLANNRFWSQHRLDIYVAIFADHPAGGRPLLSVNSFIVVVSEKKISLVLTENSDWTQTHFFISKHKSLPAGCGYEIFSLLNVLPLSALHKVDLQNFTPSTLQRFHRVRETRGHGHILI